ncbi:MAG: hypothetical protein OEU26_21925 [Candidatus Tectomicrobia bacterium]|nr:hypothetical protein [Candidatus Tectomicrobia bacterium]
MGHLQNMLKRLPLLYQDGELLADILAIPAVNLDVFDEQMLEIQRAHWFDQAIEFEDAAKLAALIDIPPETWQGLREFQAWVHALRNAWLRHGTATRQPLQQFVDDYTQRFQTAVRINAITTLGNWSDTPSQTRPALVENPLVRRFQHIAGNDPVEPLHRETVINRGLDDTVADMVLFGLSGGKEYMPVMINIVTGNALIYKGIIAPGDRLWLQTLEDHTVRAYTDKADVSHRLYSVSNVVPGDAWTPERAQQPAQAMPIVRGDNTLWFLPVAHFNQPGLDRVLNALADLNLRQARWDETGLDQSLFYQEPVMDLWVSWQEARPASFTITLPGGAMINPAGQTETALENRDRLQFSLNLGVQKIKAAGVEASTRILSFMEVQGSRDSLRDVWPKTFKEIGPSGADTVPDSGGVFNITDFGDSVFR